MRRPSSLRTYFNRRAPSYDNAVSEWIGWSELRQILPLLPKASRVLDFGCGTGRTTLALLSHGFMVTAYDFSTEMLDRARSKAAALGFSAQFTDDAATLAPAGWRVITCIGVLDYYPDPVPLLKELARLLTPDGTLVVTVPNATSPLSWIYAFGSRLAYPTIPRTLRAIRGFALRAGLVPTAVRPAFPHLAFLGMTLAIALHHDSA